VRPEVAELSRRDPVFAALAARHDPPPVRRPVPGGQRFATLVRAICYQQLAGRAASTIHGRLVEALGGEVTAASVIAADPDALRACGLSASKAASIRDLAEHVYSGEVALERIGRLTDDDVVAHLVRVRGIGRWTAEMFLLSTLARPDVWPVGDFGVRAGFAAAWKLPAVPTPLALMALGDPFRPYRSTLAWYCWRAADDRAAVH
jgi:3-methyladenine DNA glycosylase/8-oxoguanine DNA glycosylase